MLPKRTFEDLINEEIKVYISGLPDPHCTQKGIVISVTEYLLTLRDEAHTDTIIIPLENIVFFKKLL